MIPMILFFAFVVVVVFFIALQLAPIAELFIEALHRARILQAVWLEDFDGEITLSFKKPHPFGGVCADRWPLSPVSRRCVLLDGGQVKQPNYVKRWAAYK